jgi:hypothetical protein
MLALPIKEIQKAKPLSEFNFSFKAFKYAGNILA